MMSTITSEAMGFIAGTPVWTKAGKVPIESVSLGDLLLSRPDEGGDPDYRPVIRKVAHKSRAIVAITYIDPLEPDRKSLAFSTDNCKFWVEDRGWVGAGGLRTGYELRGADGRALPVNMVSPVYRTEMPGVGWYQLFRSYDELGNDVDFNGPSWRLVKSRTSRPTEEFAEGPILGVDVHTIEVDGFGTLYVGSSGVWVR